VGRTASFFQVPAYILHIVAEVSEELAENIVEGEVTSSADSIIF
jgi:hypothetical protein